MEDEKKVSFGFVLKSISVRSPFFENSVSVGTYTRNGEIFSPGDE